MRRHRSNLLLAISGMLLLLCGLSALSIPSVALAQPPRPTLTPTAQPPTPRPTSQPQPRPEATATPEPTATTLPTAIAEPTAAAQPTPVAPAQLPQTGDPSGTAWIVLVVGMGLLAVGAGLLRALRRAG